MAASDRDGVLAYPVETIAAGPGAIPRVVALVAAHDPLELLLGLPRNLAGQEGPAAEAMREIAEQLAAALPGVQLRLVDERMTTVTASRQLAGAGRNTRKQRQVIDQAAAVALLEAALQQERNTGAPAGEKLARGTSQRGTEADE